MTILIIDQQGLLKEISQSLGQLLMEMKQGVNIIPYSLPNDFFKIQESLEKIILETNPDCIIIDAKDTADVSGIETLPIVCKFKIPFIGFPESPHFIKIFQNHGAFGIIMQDATQMNSGSSMMKRLSELINKIR